MTRWLQDFRYWSTSLIHVLYFWCAQTSGYLLCFSACLSGQGSPSCPARWMWLFSFLEWLQSTCYTGALWFLWFKDAWRYFRIVLLVSVLPEAASADFQPRWSFQDDDFPGRISLTSVILLMPKKNEPLIQQSWAFHFCGDNSHPVASGSYSWFGKKLSSGIINISFFLQDILVS